MGHKVSNGRAEDVVVPSGEAVLDGDLYRIGLVNGFAIGDVATTDTDRKLALETDEHAWWKVKLPDALDPDVGDLLYWDDPTAFQYSGDDLAATGGGGELPCCQVRETKNDAGYATVRVRNP